jgi:hypothetical protein
MGADTFSQEAVIDLGLDRGEPESYHRPGRRTTPLWFGPAVLAALLLLTVGASAPPPPPAFAEVLRVSIGPGDPYTLTDDGRLLVQSAGLLSSYRPFDGQRQWQVAQDEPVYRLRTAGGFLLLRPWSRTGFEPGTTAISLATGAERWHHDLNVIAFAGTPLLYAVEGVRSSTTSGRRVQDTVEVLDPAVGLARWRVGVPNTAVLLNVPGVAGGPARMMLVRDDQIADLYDVSTGAHLASRKLPVADYDPENPVAIGGNVLLRHPGVAQIEVSAFDAVTLAPKWTVQAGDARRIEPCGELACLISGRSGIRAIDPVTGAERWRQPLWKGIARFGTSVVAYGSAAAADEPAAVVDPSTGQVISDLTGWKPVPGTAQDGTLLVTRELDPGPRTMVAVVAPGLDRPRLFAELPAGTGDCQATADRLVCRSMYDQLIVWEHRAGSSAA